MTSPDPTPTDAQRCAPSHAHPSRRELVGDCTRITHRPISGRQYGPLRLGDHPNRTDHPRFSAGTAWAEGRRRTENIDRIRSTIGLLPLRSWQM